MIVHENPKGLQNLIEQIKSDAIDEGQKSKNAIIEKAQDQARDIVSQAQQQAKTIIKSAQEQSKSHTDQAISELQIAARDFLALFSQRIKQHIVRPCIGENIKDIFEDKNFLFNCLQTLCLEMLKSSSSIDIVINEKLKTQLRDFFSKKMQELIETNKKISIMGENGLRGFKIMPKQGNFSWDFTEETITAEISSLVENELADQLLHTDSVTQKMKNQDCDSQIFLEN